MSWMFSHCRKITNIDLSSFDTKNLTDMNHVLAQCLKLSNIYLSSFGTKNVTEMNIIFSAFWIYQLLIYLLLIQKMLFI